MAFAKVTMSGVDAEGVCGEIVAQPAESCDHLVEDEQDSVRATDFAYLFKVSFRRNEHARRACDGLYKDGGDGIAAVGFAEPFEIEREVCAFLRLSSLEGSFARVRVADERHVRQREAEGLAVAHHARQRGSSHIDTVVGAFARDESAAVSVSFGAVVGERHFHGGIDRFGARVGEEGVIDRLRQHARQGFGEGEADRVSCLEGGGVGVF